MKMRYSVAKTPTLVPDPCFLFSADAIHHWYQDLKEQFKTHFRNVSQIMDCIGCDQCRLWGKVQVTGLATALKILFEMDEKALEYVSFHRS